MIIFGFYWTTTKFDLLPSPCLCSSPPFFAWPNKKCTKNGNIVKKSICFNKTGCTVKFSQPHSILDYKNFFVIPPVFNIICTFFSFQQYTVCTSTTFALKCQL